MLYLGADHRGYRLKESLKAYLAARGVEFEDLGASALSPDDDYVDYALAVARAVSADPTTHRGILACGSGAGVDIVANKVRGIRSALVSTIEQARAARADDDANVLALSADAMTAEQASTIVATWLATPFSGLERHRRRLAKLATLEAELFR